MNKWYSPESAFVLMEQSRVRGDQLPEFWADQLNAAFAKGKQVGEGEVYAMHDAMKEGFTERLADMTNEVRSVLMLMDGLAEQWGDEGVFRRCRDRLRNLVEG